jgi:hypothetical protein
LYLPLEAIPNQLDFNWTLHTRKKNTTCFHWYTNCHLFLLIFFCLHWINQHVRLLFFLLFLSHIFVPFYFSLKFICYVPFESTLKFIFVTWNLLPWNLPLCVRFAKMDNPKCSEYPASHHGRHKAFSPTQWWTPTPSVTTCRNEA